MSSGASTLSARSVLQGELDDVGLPTLLTIMEMERRSGVVIVRQHRRLGRLTVRDGRVVSAHIEDCGRPNRTEGGKRPSRIDVKRPSQVEGAQRPRQIGREAIFDMLGWTDGRFEVWRTPPTAHSPSPSQRRCQELDVPIAFLLLEAARRADEAQNETDHELANQARHEGLTGARVALGTTL